MDVSETTTTSSTSGSASDDQTAKGQAKDKAREIAGEARDQAGQAAEQARGSVREQVDQRSTQAGERVSTQARDLRSVADALREQGKDQPARLAEQAAERAERLGGYLEQSDADRILRDVEDLARRQPVVVGLAAAALGFAGARFLKASSQRRSRDGGERPSLPRTTGSTGDTGTAGTPAGTATAGTPATAGAPATTGPGAATPTGTGPGTGAPPTAHPAAGVTSADRTRGA